MESTVDIPNCRSREASQLVARNLFATKIDWVPLSGYQTNSCIDYFAIQNKRITSESRALLESSSIDKLKYINWMFRDFPEMKDWYPRIHSAVNGQYHRGTRQTEGIHLRNVQPACTRLEGCRRSALGLICPPAGLTHAIIDLEPGVKETRAKALVVRKSGAGGCKDPD